MNLMMQNMNLIIQLEVQKNSKKINNMKICIWNAYGFIQHKL